MLELKDQDIRYKAWPRKIVPKRQIWHHINLGQSIQVVQHKARSSQSLISLLPSAQHATQGITSKNKMEVSFIRNLRKQVSGTCMLLPHNFSVHDDMPRKSSMARQLHHGFFLVAFFPKAYHCGMQKASNNHPEPNMFVWVKILYDGSIFNLHCCHVTFHCMLHMIMSRNKQ